MKTLTRASLLVLAALLSGCGAHPYAHADQVGYQAGIEGTWKDAGQGFANLLQPHTDDPVYGGGKTN